MLLELHDTEPGNALVARINKIDYDYQAEMRVQDTHGDPRASDVVKWILYDEAGIRCVWERKPGSTGMPTITQRSARFTGEWERGSLEVAI